MSEPSVFPLALSLRSYHMLHAASKYLKKIPNQERSRQTVAAIIQASAQIMTREGPTALTTENIARVAGVSVGSIYQYFETKDAIILAMMMEIIAGFDRRVRELTQQYPPGSVDLHALAPGIVDALLALHWDSPEAFGALFEYMALQGHLQAVESVIRELEAWTAAFLVEQGFVSEELAEIRARSLVHGIAAIVRTTIRYAPQTLRDDRFRRELERLLFVLIFAESPLSDDAKKEEAPAP